METINQNLLSAALRKAMTDEHLWSHNAAKLLNLNPAYVSMMLNPNSFDKAGSTAWKKIEDWHNTNNTLSDYKFPEDEPVWKPKEKAESKDYNIQSPKKERINDKKAAPSTKKGTPIVTATDLGGGVSKKMELQYKAVDKFSEKNQPVQELTVLESRESTNETTRLKIALDIEINLIVNGQKVQLN